MNSGKLCAGPLSSTLIIYNCLYNKASTSNAKNTDSKATYGYMGSFLQPRKMVKDEKLSIW